jgi:hypothetical protein
MFYFYFPPPFLPCSFPPILPYLYPIHFVLPLSVLTVICAAFLRVLAISLRLKPQPSRPLGLTLTATLCTVRPLYDRRARPPHGLLCELAVAASLNLCVRLALRHTMLRCTQPTIRSITAPRSMHRATTNPVDARPTCCMTTTTVTPLHTPTLARGYSRYDPRYYHLGQRPYDPFLIATPLSS